MIGVSSERLVLKDPRPRGDHPNTIILFFNSSSIKKHFNNQHDCLPDTINQHLTVLHKCKTKQDCLILFMKCYTLGNCHPLLMSKATRSRQSYLYNIFFITPSMQIMLSIYLNSSTCKYLSLDNGVMMTSKRLENINLVSFICLSFLVISFSKQLLYGLVSTIRLVNCIHCYLQLVNLPKTLHL